MFSEAERDELRQELLERGRQDERISGGAVPAAPVATRWISGRTSTLPAQSK